MSETGADDRQTYDQMFADSGEKDDQTGFAAGGLKKPTTANSSGHSSTVREPAAFVPSSKENRETFDRAGDEPDDKPSSRSSISAAPSSITLDFVTAKLGATNYYPDSRFDWCLGIEGRRMRFSRRYIDPHVLVDVFNNDTKAVRQEVERKQEILLKHNREMKILWDEKEEELEQPQARLLFISRGLVAMGYLPILSARIAAAPFASARLGEICSLPESLMLMDHTIGSTQLGMRTVI